ncbi:fatty acid desaturase-domain-containing protein [Powellomyces hirtus]|nr:fatty acid desaturase-domain-containing protein [Powellomyces hirtus]
MCTTTGTKAAAVTAEPTAVRSRPGKATAGSTVGPDPRHPLYLGDWERSIPHVHNDIAMDNLDEPHIKRKHAILEKHPQITQLYGYEPLTKYVTVLAASLQLGLAYYFGKINTDSTWVFLLTIYVVGASLTQVFGVIIHEATHNLCGETLAMNRAVGFLANVGIPVPIFSSFRRYHLEHHAYQGVLGKDPDLPLDWEVKLIKSNPLAKFTFLFFYPMMYVVRGAAQQKKPSTWEIYNILWSVATDILVVKFCGWRGFLYLFLSLWLGYGVHPAAAHFIQEHFTFDDGQETYSYYGSLNYLFMNIGYHNEHHDFTKVPWSGLRKVRAIAPEFYNTLQYHTSWVMVHWRFIFQKDVGPQSRVGRDYEDHKKGRKMVVEMKNTAPAVERD